MRKLVATAAACTLAACAGSRSAQKPITVSDADYGRLPPGQTQLVDAARADRNAAFDAIARAKLRQQEAKHEVELAQADEKAADAERMRVESVTRAAKESNDPAHLEQARVAAETGQLRKATADAHLDYARKLQALRDGEVAAAERRAAYADVRVEQARLQALQTAGIPAAAKYDAAGLAARVTEAGRDVQAADNRVSGLNAEMTSAGQRWQQLDRQLQARGGAPATRG